MAYREAAKEKTVKRRIVLTRGEVRDIVRQYLHVRDLAPDLTDESAECNHLVASLSADNDWRIEVPDAKVTPWDDAPCFAVEWNEDVPE